MRRRHLFDHGYPVSAFTLLGGSAVLLAVSRRSLWLSQRRLANALLRLGNSMECVEQSLARSDSARIVLSQFEDAPRRP